jgi:hypothetical protein
MWVGALEDMGRRFARQGPDSDNSQAITLSGEGVRGNTPHNALIIVDPSSALLGGWN